MIVKLLDLTTKIPKGSTQTEWGNLSNDILYQDNSTLVVRRVSSKQTVVSPYTPWYTQYTKRSIFGVTFWRLEKIHYNNESIVVLNGQA